ncbi:MAG: hypothetical protein ACREGI_05420, partial [Candidatus Levyibacteriota bacterium]
MGDIIPIRNGVVPIPNSVEREGVSRRVVLEGAAITTIALALLGGVTYLVARDVRQEQQDPLGAILEDYNIGEVFTNISVRIPFDAVRRDVNGGLTIASNFVYDPQVSTEEQDDATRINAIGLYNSAESPNDSSHT